MKPQKRFIKSVVDTARKSEVSLPWTRGTVRADFIARRTAATAAATPQPAKAS